MSDTLVYLRSDNSKVHLGVRRGKTIRTAEACNVDELAEREILEDIQDVPSSELCARCFPRTVIQGQEESVTL